MNEPHAKPIDQLTDRERIAALERQVQFLTRNLTNETRPTLTQQQQRIDELEERLATLEAAPDAAGQQGFAPGWVKDEDPFMTGVNAETPDIYFIYPSVEGDNKSAVIAQQELIRLVFHYDKAKLEKLIGAAIAVLKRMEADSADLSG